MKYLLKMFYKELFSILQDIIESDLLGNKENPYKTNAVTAIHTYIMHVCLCVCLLISR